MKQGVQVKNSKERISEIIDRVMENFPVDLSRFENRDPFELLVAVILSQKTNRENVRAALERFRSRFESLKEVASADVKLIAEAIKPAGLWRMKAPRIKQIAEELVKGGITLERILALPYEDAKKMLSSMKGIGPKTADVFLMIARREPVLPIDTHIFRIMRRLGVADERDDYESLRKKLESATKPNERMRAHLALIEFGRKICRARNPKCGMCPFKSFCQFHERRCKAQKDSNS